jgi:hypothetical protein
MKTEQKTVKSLVKLYHFAGPNGHMIAAEIPSEMKSSAQEKLFTLTFINLLTRFFTLENLVKNSNNLQFLTFKHKQKTTI